MYIKIKGWLKMGELLTVKEVAYVLRVDDTTVRNWVKRGVLDAIELPKTGPRKVYRIRRETLEALLEAVPLEKRSVTAVKKRENVGR